MSDWCSEHGGLLPDVCHERIAELEAQVQQLREALEHCKSRPHEHNPGPEFTVTHCEVIDRALAATAPDAKEGE